MLHPDSLLVYKVEFVLEAFTGTPQVPPVSLKLNLLSILQLLLAGPGTKDVESWYLVDAALHVEGLDPLIDPGNLVPPIPVAWTAGPVVREPH